MEAEGRIQKENQKINPEWMKSRMRNNVTAKNIFLNKYFEISTKSGIGQGSKEDDESRKGRKMFAF